MSISRQLAAIMFTDIVGYSSLMSEDEQVAFGLIKKNRQIQRPLIEKYNGRWLKELGDGVLASFSTVTDAVYCAGAIQDACAYEPDLNLRIGIHLGEVIFEGDDVFGDGVNIASRLEPLAPVGGILVSESVNRNLDNKKGITSSFVDEMTLKNLKNPIKTYEIRVESPRTTEATIKESVETSSVKTHSGSRVRLVLPVAIIAFIALVALIFVYKSLDSPHDATKLPMSEVRKSIAVLPFSDFSPEKDQEWFSDGLTEELLNCLTRLPELQVTARTSSFAFKGKDLPVQQIADSLGVNYIVEGSVRKDGDKLRVTAQLIIPDQDSHLWSQNYDREFKDVFAIQEDIANNIVAGLGIYLDDNKRNQMFAFGTRDPVAYEYYLQGNLLFEKAHSNQGNTLHDLTNANIYYEQATEADPDFSAPWYRKQDVYSHLLALSSDEHWPDSLSRDMAMEQVLTDINMARTKAKTRPEALFYEMEYAIVSNNWSRVPSLFDELEVNPDYFDPISHFGGGWSKSLFISLERADLGLTMADYGLAKDPLSARFQRDIANYLTAINQYDSAAYWSDMIKKRSVWGMFLSLMLDPNDTGELANLQFSDIGNRLLRLFAESINQSNPLPENFENDLHTPGAQLIAAYIYSFAGNQNKADSIALAVDSRFMGAFTISDLIAGLGGKIRFNLSSTPNFAARLKEGGINDLEAYQERHWIDL